MTGLLLLGASGLAREVIASGVTDVVGVLDDNVALHGTKLAGVPIIGALAEAVRRSESLLICIGPSVGRRSVVRRLAAAGVTDRRYATYIAASASVGSTSTVAHGSIVLEGTVVTADARIGRHVVLMPNCTVTHDIVIDDYATLAAGVALGGAVHVREAAYLGMNTCVRPGLTIGRGATVGMGAVVLSDVPDEQTWAGVPARPLGVAA